MLFDQIRIEAIMTGRYGGVGGEHHFPRHARHGAVETDAFLLHPRVNRFQHGKSAVPLIQVKNARHDAHGFEGTEASNAQQQLLPDASPRVATVKPGSQFSVVRSIGFYVRIEKKQVAASHRYTPDFGMNRTVAGLDLHHDGPSIPADRGLKRQLIDVGLQIFFLLPAVTIQALAKISLPIKQTDADERNGEIGRALDMVSGKNTEPAGIDGKRFVYAEFRGKIGDRMRPQDAGVPGSPSAVRLQIFLQAAIGVVDAAVQYEFGGASLQFRQGKLRQQ